MSSVHRHRTSGGSRPSRGRRHTPVRDLYSRRRHTLTSFGIDVSHFQAGLDLAQARAAGIEFLIAKCTQGSHEQDQSYADFHRQAVEAHLYFGAYHFLDTSPADAQAANLARSIRDSAVPVMIDVEVAGSSKPTWEQAVAFRDAASRHGLKVTLLYLPHWYWTELGTPLLNKAGMALVASNYGSNSPGAPAHVYPGDASDRWAGYGGLEVAFLQFNSQGRLPGHTGDVDLDAFRGPVASLAQHLSVPA